MSMPGILQQRHIKILYAPIVAENSSRGLGGKQYLKCKILAAAQAVVLKPRVCSSFEEELGSTLAGRHPAISDTVPAEYDDHF